MYHTLLAASWDPGAGGPRDAGGAQVPVARSPGRCRACDPRRPRRGAQLPSLQPVVIRALANPCTPHLSLYFMNVANPPQELAPYHLFAVHTCRDGSLSSPNVKGDILFYGQDIFTAWTSHLGRVRAGLGPTCFWGGVILTFCFFCLNRPDLIWSGGCPRPKGSASPSPVSPSPTTPTVRRWCAP